MKKLYLKVIFTAALLAALPLAGCSSMGGNQTTRNDTEIITRQSDENCPNGECPDSENDGDCKDGCPDNKDEDGKDECPKCPKKRKRGRAVFPKGSFSERKKLFPPKKPVAPPEDDDIILPDPPVEGEQPKN